MTKAQGTDTAELTYTKSQESPKRVYYNTILQKSGEGGVNIYKKTLEITVTKGQVRGVGCVSNADKI